MIKVIKADKLKVESLNATGRLKYGQEEFTYIKSFSYDDNNAIKVRFYVLLKMSETEFDLINDVTYSIADGKTFTDEKGFPVYKLDENGEVVYEDITSEETDEEGNVNEVTTSEPVKRDDDFSRNRFGFGVMIIPSIFNDINNFIGIHPNADGAIDSAE